MRRHLSAPLIISIIALIGAWGGPAMARALIDSKDVKDHSLQGVDIAKSTISSRHVTALKGSDILPDSLDGSDIVEKTLRIPKIEEAVQADRVNGVDITPFTYADPEGKSKVFYEVGGIRVAGFCNSGVLEASVQSVSNDGIIRNSITSPGQPTTVTADDDFDDGEQFQLVPGSLADTAGTLTFFEPNGDSLLIQYLAASNLPASTGHQCLIAGVAIRTDG